jgi:hypothetical protein
MSEEEQIKSREERLYDAISKIAEEDKELLKRLSE